MRLCSHVGRCICRMELQRAVTLRRQMRRMHHLKHREPISLRSTPFLKRRKDGDRQRRIRWARGSLRSKSGRPLTLRPSLESALDVPGFADYQPGVGLKGRRVANKLREELGEKNPYCYPVEGTTHNFLPAMDILTKVLRKREMGLPLHKRPTASHRHKVRVVQLLDKFLAPTSIFPTKIKLGHGEYLSEGWSYNSLAHPQAHVNQWKEIELTKILKRFKEEDICQVSFEMHRDDLELRDSQRKLEKDARHLDEMHGSTEKMMVETIQRLAKVTAQGKEAENHMKALSAQLGALRKAVTNIASALQDLGSMKAFLYKVSPPSWLEMQGNPQVNPLPATTFDPNKDPELFQVEPCRGNPLYFTSPSQLVDMFENLEHQNLTLIQHAIDIELCVEHMRASIEVYQSEFKREEERLLGRIAHTRKKLIWEEDKINELQEIVAIYLYGSNVDEEELYLGEMMEAMYAEVGGAIESGLNLLQMLTGVECIFNSLLEDLEMLPQAIVDSIIEQMNIEEHQAQQLEERQQKHKVAFMQLVERLRHSVLPAPQRQSRKPLKPRSGPPHKNIHVHQKQRLNTADIMEAFDRAYYFT